MKRATETVHTPDGSIVAGELFADTSRAVKAYPQFFEDAEAEALREVPVSFAALESATAAPGELRTTKRTK